MVPILAGRDGALARIIVKPAAGLAAEPSGFDIFHQQGGWAILAVAGRLEQHLDDLEAGVEADKIGQFERTHRVVEAEAATLVDIGDAAAGSTLGTIALLGAGFIRRRITGGVC